jgi:hypothetical protein
LRFAPPILHRIRLISKACVLIAIVLSSHLAADAIAPDPSVFAYSADTPPVVHTISEHRRGIIVREVFFSSPYCGSIHAELILPSRPQPRHGAVLFVYWLGDRSTINLSEFIPDGQTLARRGCVAMLIDAMRVQSHSFAQIRSPRMDSVDSIHLGH